MLPRSQKLSTKDVTGIMEKGRVAHSPLFLLRWVSSSEATAKIGAIVPNKISKTAVGRSTLRRKVYAAVRTFYPHIVPGIKIAILAKSPATTATTEAIRVDLVEIFKKSRLVK